MITGIIQTGFALICSHITCNTGMEDWAHIIGVCSRYFKQLPLGSSEDKVSQLCFRLKVHHKHLS